MTDDNLTQMSLTVPDTAPTAGPAPVTLTERRVVLDLVTAAGSPLHAGTALYARPDDDRGGAISLPLIYLSPADFLALGQREQITITIEPGDLLNETEAPVLGHRAPCVAGSVCGEFVHCPPPAEVTR